MRYRIDEGSNSGHCCFEFTIVDTSNREDGNDCSVCECFERSDAELIVNALNFQDARAEGNVECDLQIAPKPYRAA